MSNWFVDLFGFQEESPAQVRKHLSFQDGRIVSHLNGRSFHAGDFHLPSLDELRGSVNPGQGKPISLGEVVADAKALHADPSSNGAVFQVASQFNVLEMISPDRTPEEGVGIYSFDRTQGPACAIACGAGTVFRNYFVPLENQTGQSADLQLDCLEEIGAALGNVGGRHWRMQNGYLMTDMEGLARVNASIASRSPLDYEELKGKLRVGVQIDTEVTHQGSGNRVTQVFCSALPVAYHGLPSHAWEPFARMVLEATYEATFWTALRNFKRSGNPLLFLTLVGGGAFGNHGAWIRDAIWANLERFRVAGLQVKFVSYGHPSELVAEIISGFDQG